MLNDLYEILMEEYRQGNTVLLIVDEAQNMPVETLENLRMLSNLETSKDKLIQIVLVGQYEFEEILNLYELRQLKQRIVIRSTISPLNAGESMAYIKHRLGKAALNGSAVFTRGAIRRIVREAKGIPRSLNILCDNALITGFGYKKKPVNTKIVREVITDFHGIEEPSLLKWVLPPVALLLFIIGILFFYANKSLILSGVEKILSPHQRISVSTGENPSPSPAAAEEMKPSGEDAEISQPEQNTPASQKMETPPSPIIKTVRKGDNLFRLTQEVYGRVDDRLVAAVRKSNPLIRDMNNLPVGMEIQFPALPEGKTRVIPRVDDKG